MTTSNRGFAFTSSQFKPPEILHLAEDEGVEGELEILSSPAGPLSLKEHSPYLNFWREPLLLAKVLWQLFLTLSGC